MTIQPDDDNKLTEVRHIIDNNLINKGWIIDANSRNKNVFLGDAKTEEQQRIIDELDKIQKSIDSAKALIKSLKDEGGGTCWTLEMRRRKVCG